MEIVPLSDSMLKDLADVEQLIYHAKFNKALELVLNLEKSVIKDSLAQLRVIILKGRIYCFKEQYKQAIEIGETAYQLSQKLGYVVGSIDALLIRSHIIFLGKKEDAYNLIIEVEKLLNSIKKSQLSWYSRLQADTLLMKAIICRSKGEINEALELAKECLLIRQNLNKKLDLSTVYYLIGELYLYKSDSTSGLDYAMKSLKVQEELGNSIGIARSLYLVGTCYFVRSDFGIASRFARQSLKISEIGNFTKIDALDILAAIYANIGQLDRAIKFRKRAIKIAQEQNFNEQLIISLYGISTIYRAKGDIDQAAYYLKTSLDLSKKYNTPFGIQASLFYLILINIDKNLLDQAKVYLKQLEQFADQEESNVYKNVFLLSKALVLKNSGRIRNLTEAETLLKTIVEREIETPVIYRLALVNLCELFLEELKFTNNIEVLDEIRPLINKIYKIAEKQNAYSWLADTKLLQAKLALIQMDFDGAKQLLTQAQRIAELNGLALLALKISNEHDNLLDHLNEWNNLKNVDAPMSKRIELASFNGVVDRMQGKSVIDPPIITPEIPVLLL
ncbi:MAG: tetratricopeptide repeat protein, partial [Promethearchaeota archaeon]